MIARSAITMTKKEVVALLVVFIVYVIIGGTVFMSLEGPLENQHRKEILLLKSQFYYRIRSLNLTNFTADDALKMVQELANARSKNLLDQAWTGAHSNWNFYNSFFFAITVVTTIGYGHVSPSTTSGRIFCVFYATVGVPLTGILLAAIGDHFSKHLLKRIDRAKRIYNSKVALAINAATFLIPWLVVFLILPAAIFMYIEDWTYLEGLYYCFITLATIGFGDYVAGNFEGAYIWIYKAAVVLWIIFGLGYLAMILNYISRAMRCKQIRRMEHRLSTSFQNTQQKFGQRLDEMQKILQDFSAKQRVSKKYMRKNRSFPTAVALAAEEEKSNNDDDDDFTENLKVPNGRHLPCNARRRDAVDGDQIQRLLTLVETLKEESTQNLYRTKCLLDEDSNCGMYMREDSSSSGLPPGEIAPSRRHSLPVLLIPSPTGSHTSSFGEQKNATSHIQFPTSGSRSPGPLRPFSSFLHRRRPDAIRDLYSESPTTPIVTFDLDSMGSTNI